MTIQSTWSVRKERRRRWAEIISILVLSLGQCHTYQTKIAFSLTKHGEIVLLTSIFRSELNTGSWERKLNYDFIKSWSTTKQNMVIVNNETLLIFQNSAKHATDSHIYILIYEIAWYPRQKMSSSWNTETLLFFHFSLSVCDNIWLICLGLIHILKP